MTVNLATGGEFLLTEAAGSGIFTPEDFSSEQRQIAETTDEFVKKEIIPNLDRIESQDFGFVVEKMRSCAELGLFLGDIPEEDGGLELEKTTSMLILEKMAPTGSFSFTYCGQTGINVLPLVYYGTRDQKARYLDKLTSAEWIGAYALTEPDCGSDPLSARTTATLTEDGRYYVLNGVKQFITNASFAELFTVFAKIDGKHFSAFLVERGYAGFSVGPEEKKMGLKGSSTAQICLQDVRVPVENLLGEPGKGHKIAFNVLNIGRLKVAATSCGMAKGAFAEATLYARERKQFGRAIGEFGAIKEKLADMVAGIFTAESAVYRVAGLLDGRIAALDHAGPDFYDRYQKAIEEYAVECAIAKVFCSEILDEVVDHGVQIHGGYGYISEYPIERYYRDSRIQRIFEGTNEINRILIPTMLFRRDGSGSLALWDRVKEAGDRMAGGVEEVEVNGGGDFSREFGLIARLKHLFLLVLGGAGPVKESQEVLVALADMAITIFVLESVVLRAAKMHAATSERKMALLEAVVKVAAFESASHFHLAASRCCAYSLRGDAMSSRQKDVSSLSAYPAEGLLGAKQLLAEAAQESGKYPFNGL
ncbi:acyl-CoA dehydrogenase family protein [Geobacter sp. AOG1]|uniref:acyl-CoA dehydrogenase family protein n=1 Tax=Geobacter sp. AOG1 TaxID=1566346 RepID=UPI001CC3B95D|nr:acyl-CoA dehydrogenase family protein [Geobacter sp. AOG1]GFE56306.1 acyl-CoA dehydrogenase [Geobacter sp. AOG1]